MDRIRNKYRGTAHFRCFGDEVKKARLTWLCTEERSLFSDK